jgi:hypothetical protein
MSLIATKHTTNTGVWIGHLERERIISWLAPASEAGSAGATRNYTVVRPNSFAMDYLHLEVARPYLTAEAQRAQSYAEIS